MLAVPAVAGAVLLLAVTRRGAYLSPDSLAYVGTARNLLDGQGFDAPPGSPPPGNFAPLYSLVLAAGGALGPDPLTVARLLSPLAFGGTIAVAGLLAWRLGGSLVLAAGAQLLVLAGVDFLRYGSAALSEPLFLLLALSTIAALFSYVQRRRAALLALAAALAAATCLTRYVGLAIVAAGAVTLVVSTRRWRPAVAFSAVALAPLLAWFGWLQAVEGRASNRSAVLHLPDGSYLTTGLRSAAAWLLPDRVWPLTAVVPVALIAVAVAAVAFRRHAGVGRRDPTRAAGTPQQGALLIGLFGGFYLLALVADRLLFDVTGRLDARFMLVLHVVAILLAVWLARDADLSRRRGLAVALAAVVVLQLGRGAAWLGEALPQSTDRLGGFAATAWSHSQVLERVRTLPEAAAVYSNQPDAVWFHTGRVAALVPEERVLLTGRANLVYDEEMATMGAALARGGLLVYFAEVPARRVFLPTAGELVRRLGLVEVGRDRVGAAYRAGGVSS